MSDNEGGQTRANAGLQQGDGRSPDSTLSVGHDGPAVSTGKNDVRRFRVASEFLNFLLVVILLPVVVVGIQQAFSGNLIPTAHSVPAFAYPPKMEVWWTRDSQVGQRLHIQSRDDREFTVTDLVVNNRRECTLIDRMKGQTTNASSAEANKGDALVVAVAKAMAPPPPWKFTLGDEHQTVYTCDPVKVDVQTDQGTASFRFRDGDD